MKKSICFIFDKNYVNQGNHAILSAKKHNPDHTIILLIDDPEATNLADIVLTPKQLNLSLDTWLIVGRIAVMEYALEILGFETSIFIDGDTFTYNAYEELQSLVEKHSLVVIPHITKPLPNDGKYPQNRTISLSGNYNTGVWASSKLGLDFIKWWKEETRLFPIIRPEFGFVNEQGWLRFVGDFDDNVKIFRHPGYNVSYWNIKQRYLNLNNNTIYIDNEKLVIMHFSGFKKDISPSQMSVFQNRYLLNVDELEYKIYKDYHDLIWYNK